MKIAEYFGRFSRAQIFLVAAAFLAALGTIDYFTPDAASAIFYLIPVVFTAWFAGKKRALFVAALCSAVGFASNERWMNISAVLAWNTAVDLAIFVAASYLVAALKAALEGEKELARTDYLTSLNNSRAFYGLLETELDRARRYGHTFSLVYLDVDNFKEVNDRFGHTAGDELLRKAAAAMRESIRATDIPGRLGGDEFAVFLPETDYQQTEAVVKRLREALLKTVGDNRWPATFSIGVATCEKAGCCADELINMADNLMYSVKDHGKNDVRHELFK